MLGNLRLYILNTAYEKAPATINVAHTVVCTQGIQQPKWDVVSTLSQVLGVSSLLKVVVLGSFLDGALILGLDLVAVVVVYLVFHTVYKVVLVPFILLAVVQVPLQLVLCLF